MFVNTGAKQQSFHILTQPVYCFVLETYLNHKGSPNKFQGTNDTWIMFSDHNPSMLDISIFKWKSTVYDTLTVGFYANSLSSNR